MFYCHRRTSGKEDILELLEYQKKNQSGHILIITLLQFPKFGIHAINAVKDNKDSRLKTIYFENFIKYPEKNLKDICQFLEIEFDSNMLNVPKIGSSTGVDEINKLGIDKTKLGKWKLGGLSSSELYICQKMCSENMNDLGYEYEIFKSPPILVFFSLITFPLKLLISFTLNLNRIKNFKDLINKRIMNK